MNERLKELGGLLPRPFTRQDLEALEALERSLAFPAFNSQIALELGSRLVEKAKEYGGEIAVQITRCRDEAVIFQYIGESKAPRNLGFIEAKRKAALATGHTSLWMLVCGLAEQRSWPELEEGGCLPVGGVFPIYVEGSLKGTVGISGLKEGKDFLLVAEVLADYLGQKPMDVSFPLI